MACQTILCKQSNPQFTMSAVTNSERRVKSPDLHTAGSPSFLEDEKEERGRTAFLVILQGQVAERRPPSDVVVLAGHKQFSERPQREEAEFASGIHTSPGPSVEGPRGCESAPTYFRNCSVFCSQVGSPSDYQHRKIHHIPYSRQRGLQKC